MNIAGKFHRVSEFGKTPLVIGFIGTASPEKLNAKNIDYIKGFYHASGKSHRFTADFPVARNASHYTGFMIIE